MEPTYDPTNPFGAPDEVSSGDPRPGRSRRAVVGAVLTAALLGAGATGVALASTNDSATPSPGSSGAPSPGAPDQDRDGFRHGPGMMGRGFGGPGHFGLMGAIHGEVVVPKAGGGYQTLLMQRGKATAVSASSITVKSDDGFTATYDVTKDTVVGARSTGITSIDENSDVVVMARKSGAGGTALHVLDLSNLPDFGRFHHRFDDDDDNGPGSSTTPSPGSTTGSSVRS